jgi:electron transport complex protein RnfC
MSPGFSGGIHPPEQKLTEESSIETLPGPKRVYVPFSQHTGKPAQPLVKKDDVVKVGTKIGESDGFISVPVHATISGKVIALAEHPHPVLGRAQCCVIEATGDEVWEETIHEQRDYEQINADELLAIIKEAGIVGLGGAAFPTYVKLSPPQDKPIDTLIINGCECEPALTADHRLMLECPEEIIAGARIFQKILQAERLIIAIEDNKKDAAELFQRYGLDVRLLRTKYPQGAEKQLIKAILNREVPRGGLPMDVRCVVQNVGTCNAAYQAVTFHKPLIDRVVTVAGDGVTSAKNVLVRIGTPVIDLINFCGGYAGQPRMLILGGPMMGIAQYSEEVPIIKGTSGVIVSTHKKIDEESPCVRCAHCVDVCPMGLMPCEICRFVKYKNFEKARAYGILDCIECGCCAYACPARIPLVHYLKFGKAEVWRLSKK